MTFQQSYILGLLVLALVLFVTHWVRFDVVAVIILALLVLPAVVDPSYAVISPREALHGFASEAIIILVCIFIIARALQRTGFSDAMATRLQRLAAGRERGLFAMLLGLIGSLSAFVNNTTMTAMAIPIVLRCSNRLGVSPSRIYLPLAYMSLVGGVMTLIGTTTNIAVSNVLEGEADPSTPPIGMFEMLPAGLIFTVVGGLLLFFFAPRFLRGPRSESLFGKYDVKEFLSEILVKADSDVVGRPLQDLHFGHDYDLTIVGVVRDGKTQFAPPPTLLIREGDVLMVQGGVESIISLRKEKRLEMVNELRLEQGMLRSLDVYMAEVVLLPNSSFIGRTIRDIDLRDYYGVSILAFSRLGLRRAENLADIPLKMGDTLLIQGHLTGLERLRRHTNLLVLETHERSLTHPRLPVALAILGALVVACVVQSQVLFLNFLLAALALLATRCVALRDIYDFVDWRILVLIGALLPLGRAVEQSDLVDLLAPILPASPMLLLATVYLVTFALTQIISNTASAALMTPIALDLARTAGVHHRSLVMAVAFAASFSFITPFAHQACTLVMGSGNYRTTDYLKLGSFLGAALFVVALFVIPIFFPFAP